ncbi:MAG: hypothetical protein WAV09_01290 [Minisyncoccia bacterium]
MEVETKLAELRKQQAELTQRMSVLVLQSIFIFGVPAILGYFMGVYLENRGIMKALAYLGPLLLTFVFSWVILMRKLHSFKEEVEKVEEGIRKLVPPVVSENKEELDEKRDLK